MNPLSAVSASLAIGALLTISVLAALLFAQWRDRRRAETLAAEQAVALHRSEGAFLAVAESARVAIVTTDAQGHFTYANAAAEQMLGASRDQLRGVNSAQYLADVDRRASAVGRGISCRDLAVMVRGARRRPLHHRRDRRPDGALACRGGRARCRGALEGRAREHRRWRVGLGRRRGQVVRVAPAVRTRRPRCTLRLDRHRRL